MRCMRRPHPRPRPGLRAGNQGGALAVSWSEVLRNSGEEGPQLRAGLGGGKQVGDTFVQDGGRGAVDLDTFNVVPVIRRSVGAPWGLTPAGKECPFVHYVP